MKSFLFFIALVLSINESTSQRYFSDLEHHNFNGPPEFAPSYYSEPAIPLPRPRRRPSSRDYSQFDSSDIHRSRNHVIETYRPLGGPRIMRDHIDPIGGHDIRPRFRDQFGPLERHDSQRRRTDLIDLIGRRRSNSHLSDPYGPFSLERSSSSSRLSDPYNPHTLDRPSSSSRLSDPYNRRTLDRPSSSSRLSDPYPDILSSTSRLSDPYTPFNPSSSSILIDLRNLYDSRPFSRRGDPFERPLTASSRTSAVQHGERRDRHRPIRRPIGTDYRSNRDRMHLDGVRTFNTRDARRSRGRIFPDNSPRPDHHKYKGHVNRLIERPLQSRVHRPQMTSSQISGHRYSNQTTQG